MRTCRCGKRPHHNSTGLIANSAMTSDHDNNTNALTELADWNNKIDQRAARDSSRTGNSMKTNDKGNCPQFWNELQGLLTSAKDKRAHEETEVDRTAVAPSARQQSQTACRV